MTEYMIPTEPAGPVWDTDGTKWGKCGGQFWDSDGSTQGPWAWHELLHYYGPVKDYPPEPDWLDAPAIFARCDYCSHEDHGPQITLHGTFIPGPDGQKWECTECQTATTWHSLTDVTPLYPKGPDA